MGIYDKQLTDEELQAQMLGIPLRPAEEIAPLAEQNIKQEAANEMVNSEVENPYIQPKEEDVNLDQLAGSVEGLMPEDTETDMQKLMRQYEEGKSERAARMEEAKSERDANRGQAQIMDAADLINRSLAGQAGHKIEAAPKHTFMDPTKDIGKDTSLEELMTKYKMGALDVKAKTDAKKAETKAKEPTFAEKELQKGEIKEGIATRKENRKMKQEMKKSIPALDEQLTNIKEARAALKEGSTGPIDQITGYTTKTGQKLKQALNKISLSTMVKMFSGMSKAIDSDAERAFFQSAQPAMDKYETVNEDILDKMEANVKSLKAKAKQGMGKIDSAGNMKETPESSAGDTVSLRAPDGTIARVKRSKIQKYLDKGATIIEE